MNIELIEYKISISTPFNIYVTRNEVLHYMKHCGLEFKREVVYDDDSFSNFTVRFFLASGHKIFVQNSNLIAYKVPFIDKYGFLSEIEIENAIRSDKYIELLSVVGGVYGGEVKEVKFADVVMLLQKYVEYIGLNYSNDIKVEDFIDEMNLNIVE